MNKSKLIDTLREETSLSRPKSKEVVDLFFDEMSGTLANGDKVEIRGLCSIFVKQYKGYTGRNPKTGEPRQVPPKKLPVFRCGLELKQRVDYKETKTKEGGKRR